MESNQRVGPIGASRWTLLRFLAPLLLAGMLVSCAGEFETVGEALRLVQRSLPDAVVNEPYDVQINAVGGLRPYTFEVDAGALPPGMALQNGALRGTPTELGSYEFSVAVSDGNLNKTVQEYRLVVTEIPPPSFTLSAPLTEVRDAVTLRARVEGARQLQGVRVAVSWDPELFSLRPGSVSAATRDVALFSKDDSGSLQVDLTALGRVIDGDQTLFTFVLEPQEEPASLWLDERVEFLHASPDPARKHHFVRQDEGRRSTLRQDGTPGVDPEAPGLPGDDTDPGPDPEIDPDPDDPDPDEPDPDNDPDPDTDPDPEDQGEASGASPIRTGAAA